MAKRSHWTREFRQRYRLRHRAKGLCIYCQNARSPASANFCEPHLEMVRRLNREGAKRRRALRREMAQ